MSIPPTMRAVVLKSFDPSPSSLVIKQVPVPTLKPGDVLVRMAAAPINPSDLVFLRNQYGIKKPVPVIPGFEGSGVVVETNGGFYARSLVGRRVACRASIDGNGTWAEYLACPASHCIPLKKGITVEQGASLLVNPLTAWAFLKRAKRGKHRAIIQTAAASALGKMVLRLCQRMGIETISIVRRPEQVAMLKALGAVHVFDSNESDFAARLQTLAAQLSATIAFDAVGGPLTGILTHAMPRGSTVIVYGALSGRPCDLTPTDFIFEGKTVSGFWMTEWLKKVSLIEKLTTLYQVQGLLATDLATTVLRKFPYEKIHEAIDFCKKNRSDGKVLVGPSRND